MTNRDDDAYADGADRAFATLQDLLPKHALSKAMHRLARSTNPLVRKAFIGTILRAYPTIDMREAEQPDPYAYASFNAFFARALRAGARPIAGGAGTIARRWTARSASSEPSRAGRSTRRRERTTRRPRCLQTPTAEAKYGGGAFACLYLAPYNYHRIHMPVAGRLTATRYVPGEFFSVNPATVRAVPGLFARNERVVCEFDTALGPMAMVLVGALFVGSIETVYAGEINPPAVEGRPRDAPSPRASAASSRRERRSAASTWARP